MGNNCIDQSLDNGEIAFTIGLISVYIRKPLILLITESVVKEGARAACYCKHELNVSILLDPSFCC